jgi:hypothetical protein
VIAAAPMMLASSSTMANSARSTGSLASRALATPSASVKCPASRVPLTASAPAIISAPAPTTTTIEPRNVSARS